MDKKEIVKILEIFSERGLKSLTIEKDKFFLSVEADEKRAETIEAEDNTPVQKDSLPKEAVRHQVKSPIVGVYYEAPSPEAKPFVNLGDFVKKDQVVCIIEAMKMMNEIKSPVSGIVSRINFKNEDLVQYDDVIMEIEEDV